ncbi:MAG: glycine C-acetyltransferase [Calditrichia bacterium]
MMLGPPLKFVERNYVIYEDKKLLYFGGIDYHRLSNHPEVLHIVSMAASEYGLNPTGSRTTTGNHPLYLQLEKKISEFFQSEGAVVFASGYLANMILLQAVAEKFDIFFLDKISHSSIVDAVRQFDKKTVYFKHLDTHSLEMQLKKHMKKILRALIVTDGVFAARGEIPPLDEYLQVMNNYSAKLLVDDAHAMAVVGATGKGSWEVCGIDRSRVYQTGTLSKGFGIAGGIIPAETEVVEAIRQKSMAFVGSTGLALPLAAAAIYSIDYLLSKRDLITSLQERSIDLKNRMRKLGFDIPLSPAPIVSITFYDEAKNKRLFRRLIEKGIYPPFINYPGAPPGGHFRFAISSHHSEADIERLYEAVESSV